MTDGSRLRVDLLEKALSQFRQALLEYQTHPEVRAYRDSVVIHFLFTYELSLQAIRRFVQLEHIKPVPESELTLPRTVRRANALGIWPGEWEDFIVFRDARNAIAHTYSESKAQTVVELAERFASDAQFLLNQLRGRLSD